MNIFRHMYVSEDDTVNNMWKDLSNIGFDWINNTPIDKTIFWKSDNTFDHKVRYFKWGKDSKLADDYEYRYDTRFYDHVYFKIESIQADARPITSNNPRIYTSAGGSMPGQGYSGFIYSYGSSLYSYTRNFVFIPLINDGFVSLNYTGGSGTSLYSYQPTLPIYTWKNFCRGSAPSTDEYPSIGIVFNMNLCVKTTLNTSNPFTYFHVSGDNSWSFYQTTMATDFGHSTVANITLPGVTGYPSSIIQNRNVCTLMKIPYDNKYMNNLYVCTTNPIGTMPEGKFFSFGGRNFFGCFQNLVVELPSD